MFLGGSRSSHCEDNGGRSGTRYGSHAPTPGDSTPSAPQQARSRRPAHEQRMDTVPNNTMSVTDDVVTASMFKN